MFADSLIHLDGWLWSERVHLKDDLDLFASILFAPIYGSEYLNKVLIQILELRRESPKNEI